MSAPRQSRADLHIHSRYSDRPSEWFLRRIGAPESYVRPAEIYQSCRNAGMDFVTIADHNCIRGALEIAEYPGTFLSAEMTTYFPEDGCKIHCLVIGITEEWFRDLQQARENIYDFRKLLHDKNILYSVAHPLFRVNDRLGVEHFEKMLLLFNRFEGINGSRDQRACAMANAVFEHLTPEFIAQLAERHEIEPAGPEPWKKILTGGSDDHSGLFHASAHTVTPHAATVFDFLEHLRAGRCEPGGHGGSSLRLADSLYQIAYSFYTDRMTRNGSDTSLLGALLRNLAGKARMEHKGIKKYLVKPFVKAYQKHKLNDIERLLVKEFSTIMKAGRADERTPAGDVPIPDLHFRTACRLSQQLSFNFLEKCAEQIREGNLIESLQSLSSMGPVLLGIAPYVTAFGAQHKDETFLRAFADHFPAASPLRQRTGKKLWITDTFDDVNGVAHTINTLAGMAHQTGHKDITVMTCLEKTPQTDYPLKNFTPVGTFHLPEYESQTLVFPPFLEMVAWMEEEGFDELILSTPGPLGLVGVLAARLLGLTKKGIYHTDFPRYILQWTDDNAMEDITWKYMRWFYGDMEMVYVPSRPYFEQLRENGFAPRQLAILPRGVNLERFHPGHRDESFWNGYGSNGGFKFLYVGRVSSEKNVETLLEAFCEFAEGRDGAELIIVGEGPDFKALKKKYRRAGILFTGYLSGDPLSKAYASADVFVFPSMTDTFGNVVLEAHASGLPAIVANEGGPPEIVRSHDSGLIVDASQPSCLADAMASLYHDEALRARLREGALNKARESRWETALDML
jgi:glycosyltransferase involved in cell wall biosynthesis/predicted metal-dependent phosphoesterase TrpH